MIGLTGSDSAAAGSFFSSRQRLTKRCRGVRARSLLKSKRPRVEVADARIGLARASSARSGSARQRVVHGRGTCCADRAAMRGTDGCGAPGGAPGCGTAIDAGGVVARAPRARSWSGLPRTAVIAELRASKRIALAVAALQVHADAEHVAEEQRVGLDQHRLASRMRLAQHRRAAEQARRVAGLDRARLGRARLGDVADVARRSAAPGCGRGGTRRRRCPAIRPPKKPRSPMPVSSLRREEERLVEVLGPQLDPDLVVLLPAARTAPSMRFASLIDVGERRAARPARRRPARAPGGRRPEAAPPGPSRAGWRPTPRRRPARGGGRAGRRRSGSVAQPPSSGGGEDQARRRGRSEGRGVLTCERPSACRAGTAHSMVRRRQSVLRHCGKSLDAERAGEPAPARSVLLQALKRSRCGLAPSSPRRFFLSASYSW